MILQSNATQKRLPIVDMLSRYLSGYLHRVKEVDVSQWHLAIWTNVDSGWCFANINFTKNISLIESADLALLDAKMQHLSVWYMPPTQNPPKSTRSCIYTVYR